MGKRKRRRLGIGHAGAAGQSERLVGGRALLGMGGATAAVKLLTAERDLGGACLCPSPSTPKPPPVLGNPQTP